MKKDDYWGKFRRKHKPNKKIKIIKTSGYDFQVATREDLRVGTEYILAPMGLSYNDSHKVYIVRKQYVKGEEIEWGIVPTSNESTSDWEKYIEDMQYYIKKGYIYLFSEKAKEVKNDPKKDDLPLDLFD